MICSRDSVFHLLLYPPHTGVPSIRSWNNHCFRYNGYFDFSIPCFLAVRYKFNWITVLLPYEKYVVDRRLVSQWSGFVVSWWTVIVQQLAWTGQDVLKLRYFPVRVCLWKVYQFKDPSTFTKISHPKKLKADFVSCSLMNCRLEWQLS